MQSISALHSCSTLKGKNLYSLTTTYSNSSKLFGCATSFPTNPSLPLYQLMITLAAIGCLATLFLFPLWALDITPNFKFSKLLLTLGLSLEVEFSKDTWPRWGRVGSLENHSRKCTFWGSSSILPIIWGLGPSLAWKRVVMSWFPCCLTRLLWVDPYTLGLSMSLTQSMRYLTISMFPSLYEGLCHQWS